MATPTSSELHPGTGFRIRTTIERSTDELVQALASFPTPDLCDLSNRLYAMGPAITNLVNDQSIAGPACTVKVYPGDNLMVHKVLDVAKPGDVIVIDTCGARTNAVIGDMVATKAKRRWTRWRRGWASPLPGDGAVRSSDRTQIATVPPQ